MRTKRTLVIAVATVALAILIASGIFRPARPVQAAAATATPTPNYVIAYEPVLPSDTDGSVSSDDCQDRPDLAIGCETRWEESANNGKHFLFVPSASPQSGKLLVFLCGGKGNAELCKNVYPVAARQGYHVVGLTYPTSFKACEGDFRCFGDFMRENVTGGDWSEEGRISEHAQDSVVNRLIRVLEWAHANHDLDGWDRYLTGPPGMHGVDWTQVHLAGHSNGSSHVSLMGMLYPSVGRVALFAGPNDGRLGSAGKWNAASYIQLVAGITDTRYYGLVHFRNNAEGDADADSVLYEVTNNWREFGMAGPLNPPPFKFDPQPGVTPDFGGAHMLISTNPTTDYREAHNSVVKDYECRAFKDDPDDDSDPPKQICKEFENEADDDGDGEADSNAPKIGYEPAWRCILGAGDSSVSSRPSADAGPDQTVECQGGGGAGVALDGSGSRDVDCDVLSYAWAGPFGLAGGRKPTVFLPLGTSAVTLSVWDGWWWSSSFNTTQVTVADTQPPSLQLTLTPATLWPADHSLIRVNAAVSAADLCGGTPPTVVLTSITSDQPDDGVGDGDTDGDIREADFGTFDQSFLLRAERAGSDPRGRTYTVTYTATDASGNSARASATVRVPHTR